MVSASRSPHGFAIVRGRGCGPAGVDAFHAALAEDRDASWERAARLNCSPGHGGGGGAAAGAGRRARPETYASLGKRAQRVRRLAEEEATAVREQARHAARRRWNRRRNAPPTSAGPRRKRPRAAADAREHVDRGCGPRARKPTGSDRRPPQGQEDPAGGPGRLARDAAAGRGVECRTGEGTGRGVRGGRAGGGPAPGRAGRVPQQRAARAEAALHEAERVLADAQRVRSPPPRGGAGRHARSCWRPRACRRTASRASREGAPRARGPLGRRTYADGPGAQQSERAHRAGGGVAHRPSGVRSGVLLRCLPGVPLGRPACRSVSPTVGEPGGRPATACPSRTRPPGSFSSRGVQPVAVVRPRSVAAASGSGEDQALHRLVLPGAAPRASRGRRAVVPTHPKAKPSGTTPGRSW